MGKEFTAICYSRNKLKPFKICDIQTLSAEELFDL